MRFKINLVSKLIIIVVVIFTSCTNNSGLIKVVDFNNKNIEYMGRIGKTDSTSELYWSGTSVKIEFQGTEISAILQDEHGDNYFNIIIDNDSIYTLHTNTSKTSYQLIDNLEEESIPFKFLNVQSGQKVKLVSMGLDLKKNLKCTL